MTATTRITRRRTHEDDRRLILRFTRNMFPFVPRDGELYIEKMALLFNRCEHCGCECPEECPCCMDPTPASYEVRIGAWPRAGVTSISVVAKRLLAGALPWRGRNIVWGRCIPEGHERR